ncbi:penicillin-binding protein 2 [bacterium]|nr:penicillin-binding protein 2 [candidate division CSSED10-310 bacterium]
MMIDEQLAESTGINRIKTSQRVHRVFLFFVLCIFVLAGKLWHIQVYQHDKYTTKARDNRLKVHRDKPLRGLMLDMNGDILVSNRASYSLVLRRKDVPKGELRTVLARARGLLGEDAFVLEEAMDTVGKHAKHWPTRIMSNLEFDQLAVIEAHKYELPGVYVEVTPNRFYHHGRLGAQVLGYIGEVNQEELKRYQSLKYEPGDMIGKSGLELAMNRYLHGTNGYKVVEVNALGRVVRTLAEPPPVAAIPGAQVQLTLDFDLQRAVEEIMAQYKGVVIVMAARTGGILAMASHPTYDSNLFAAGISRDDWQRLNDPTTPLMNRAIQATFPPGSVVKPLMALAALETGVVDEESLYGCPGYFDFHGHTFRCWKKGGHGQVNVRSAIEQSCNVFFYNVATQLGIETMARYARMFGLGTATGIDLGSEQPGLYPDPVWKMKRFNQKWYQGETLSVVIGQGGVTVTPIQLLLMMNTIATRGLKVKPHLIRQVIPYRESEVPELPAYQPEQLPVSRAHLDVVRDGLHLAINGRGTATRTKIKGLEIAGKTGTAQVVGRTHTHGLAESEIDPAFRDHNWFASFAPFEDPEISVLVFLENGGAQGAIDKQYIARSVYLYYFRREFQPLPEPVEGART